jgi:hypothetical protein
MNDGEDGEDAILDCDLWKLHGNLSQVSLTEPDPHLIYQFSVLYPRGGRSCLVSSESWGCAQSEALDSMDIEF